LNTLYAPESDVTNFRELLLNKDFAGFDDVRICMNSSMSSVRTEVTELFAGRTSDDLVLFYYSGHGLTDQRGRLYFALPETDSEEPSSRSLEASFIKQQMDDSNSLRQIVILDCCHSGAFHKDAELKSRDAKVPKINEHTFDPKGHGRFILSASSASESSFEKNGKSIYTQMLVDGISTGEAAPEKNEIYISDLHNYLCKAVKSKEIPMQPHFWVDSQTDPLVLSKNPNVSIPISEDIKSALESVNIMERLGGISALKKILSTSTPTQSDEIIHLLNAQSNKPNEVKIILDEINDVIQQFQLEKNTEPDDTSNIKQEQILDVSNSANTPLPIQDINNQIISPETLISKKRGRLYSAFESSTIAVFLCYIFHFVFSNQFIYQLKVEPVYVFGIPILLSIITAFETWRRNKSPRTALFSALNFNAIFIGIPFLNSIFLDSQLQNNDYYLHILLGTSFCLAITFFNAISIKTSIEIMLKLLIFSIGMCIVFVTQFIYPVAIISPDIFLLSHLPLIGIMYFLVFSTMKYDRMRKIKDELKQFLQAWNALD